MARSLVVSDRNKAAGKQDTFAVSLGDKRKQSKTVESKIIYLGSFHNAKKKGEWSIRNVCCHMIRTILV